MSDLRGQSGHALPTLLWQHRAKTGSAATRRFRTFSLLLLPKNTGHFDPGLQRVVKRLAFELSGQRRWDAMPGLGKMYLVPPNWAWWRVVGGPLERGVRPHCCPGRITD